MKTIKSSEEKIEITNSAKPRSLDKIIVFDIETTGLPGQGEIIEIGAIKYNKKGVKYKVVGMFSKRIKPETDFWSEQAAATHKITKKQLQNCKTIKEILPEFLIFLEPDYVVLGHRVGFDCTFIREFCIKHKFEIPKNILLDTYNIAINVLHIDKKLAKLNFKKKYDLHLSDLFKYYNIKLSLGSHHRAYVDALSTAEIFFKMKSGLRLSQLKPNSFDKIEFKLVQNMLKEKKNKDE